MYNSLRVIRKLKGSQMEIDKSLNDLNEEIKNTEVSDPEGKEKLDILAENISNVLESDEKAPTPHHNTLMENLQEAVDYFEVTHPKLTTLLNTVIMDLNNLGL